MRFLLEIVLRGPAVLMFGAASVVLLVTFGLVLLDEPVKALPGLPLVFVLSTLPLAGIVGLIRAIYSGSKTANPYLLSCGILIAAPVAFLSTMNLSPAQLAYQPGEFLKDAWLAASLWSCVLVALFHLRNRSAH